MRLYGKKFLKQRTGAQISQRQETRDAILWDVLQSQRLCRVKIQGSNELVVAHYPENWEQTPFWLKPGNSVKIVHTAGVRGRIEVIGHGQTVPTPVAGGQFPDPEIPEDAVMTGLGMTQCWNDPDMVVFVEVGTYRIGGTTYALTGVPLGNDYYEVGDGGKLGDIAAVVHVNAAPPAGYFRYDLICVGSDGVVDYVPGSALATPVMPTTPASHVAIGHVLLDSSTVAILQDNINKMFIARAAATVTVVPTDDDLAWGETSTAVRVTVKDQYGNAVAPDVPAGWYIKLRIEMGNGTVSSAEEGSDTYEVGQHSGSLSYCDFTYTRNGFTTDSTPLLTAILETDVIVSASALVILRDAEGNIMRGIRGS